MIVETPTVEVTEEIREIHVDPRSEKIYLTAGSDVLLDTNDITVSPENVPFTELDLQIEDPALAYIPEQTEDDIREYGLRIVALTEGETKLRVTLRGTEIHFDIELHITAPAVEQTAEAETELYEESASSDETYSESDTESEENVILYEDNVESVIPYPEE